jgi:hypothetical protein
MGMERSCLRIGPRLDQGACRELLALTSGSCIEEGDLRDLFEGEELRLMTFNSGKLVLLRRKSRCNNEYYHRRSLATMSENDVLPPFAKEL